MSFVSYCIRYLWQYLSIRFLPLLYLFSSFLMNIFFPVYRIIWRFYLENRYFFVFELFPCSPGHISSDYQRAMIGHIETDQRIIIVGPYSINLDDFSRAFNNCQSISGVSVFASSFLYLFLVPFSFFQCLSCDSKSLKLLKYCSSNHLLQTSRSKFSLFRLFYFKVSTKPFANTVFSLQTHYLSAFTINYQRFSELSSSIKSVIKGLSFRSKLKTLSSCNYFPYSLKLHQLINHAIALLIITLLMLSTDFIAKANQSLFMTKL